MMLSQLSLKACRISYNNFMYWSFLFFGLIICHVVKCYQLSVRIPFLDIFLRLLALYIFWPSVMIFVSHLWTPSHLCLKVHAFVFNPLVQKELELWFISNHSKCWLTFILLVVILWMRAIILQTVMGILRAKIELCSQYTWKLT